MTDHLSQVQIPITTGEGILKGHGSASQQQKDLWHTCIREMMPNGIALSKQWQRESSSDCQVPGQAGLYNMILDQINKQTDKQQQ